ncbi:unnamed protein product [Arctogadus glacialis]
MFGVLVKARVKVDFSSSDDYIDWGKSQSSISHSSSCHTANHSPVRSNPTNQDPDSAEAYSSTKGIANKALSSNSPDPGHLPPSPGSGRSSPAAHRDRCSGGFGLAQPSPTPASKLPPAIHLWTVRKQVLKYSKTTPSVLQQDHGPLAYSKTTALCPTARPPPSVLQQDPMPSVLQQDPMPSVLQQDHALFPTGPSPLFYRTTPSVLPDHGPMSYWTTALFPTGPRPLSYSKTTALCPTEPRPLSYRTTPSVLPDHALCPTGPQPSVLQDHALCPTGPRPRWLRLTERKVEEDDHLLPPGHRPSVLWRSVKWGWSRLKQG